jgi:hypothetical protein
MEALALEALRQILLAH